MAMLTTGTAATPRPTVAALLTTYYLLLTMAMLTTGTAATPRPTAAALLTYYLLLYTFYLLQARRRPRGLQQQQPLPGEVRMGRGGARGAGAHP